MMKQPIPEQITGDSSDTSYRKQCANEQQAIRLFEKAKQRLLNVNEWETLTGIVSADFKLTDAKGELVNRQVQLHDHFRINIPGPGNGKGDGYDWVRVEDMKESESEIYFRVRPADNPQNDKDEVAHFFDNSATSTFSLQRSADIVIASVHGRNEKPNTDTESLIDKARNAIVSLTAVTAFSKIQWSQLVKGIIEGEN